MNFLRCAAAALALNLLLLGGCADLKIEREQAPAEPAEAAVAAYSSVTITNLGPGRFALESDSRVALATVAEIERQTAAGQWQTTADGTRNFWLAKTCPDAVRSRPSCLQLNPGEVLIPIPWNGQSCGGQCAESCDTAYSPGTYRLQVRACQDAATRFHGESFEMPATPEMVSRHNAAAGVAQVSVARLQAGGIVDSNQSTTGRLAGYAVSASGEREVSADLIDEFALWLRSADGFDDLVERRCRPGILVGFRLLQAFSDTVQTTSEVAVDFRCEAIAIVTGQGQHRSTVTTNFGPSREALLNLVRRMMPLDQELADLR